MVNFEVNIELQLNVHLIEKMVFLDVYFNMRKLKCKYRSTILAKPIIAEKNIYSIEKKKKKLEWIR